MAVAEQGNRERACLGKAGSIAEEEALYGEYVKRDYPHVKG
ncbi:hypothetical protein MKX64_21290 [Paenibacillus sp. FSL M8-0334]